MSVALLAAVIVAAISLLTWVVFSNRTPAAAPEASPLPAPTIPTDTATSSSPTAPSPSPAGSDATEELTAPDGSRQVASRFIRAWLDRDPATREPALKEVAAPALAEQLMLTDPANIPRAKPRGNLVLNDASAYSAAFTQTLSTGMRIQVYLVADPTARYQWLTTSVDRA